MMYAESSKLGNEPNLTTQHESKCLEIKVATIKTHLVTTLIGLIKDKQVKCLRKLKTQSLFSQLKIQLDITKWTSKAFK